MIPSFSQVMSGLSFAFSLLRGRPFDLVKSQVNIGPLGLWHVLFITSIVSILAKLAIFQIAIPHELPLRMILSTIPVFFDLVVPIFHGEIGVVGNVCPKLHPIPGEAPIRSGKPDIV